MKVGAAITDLKKPLFAVLLEIANICKIEKRRASARKKQAR